MAGKKVHSVVRRNDHTSEKLTAHSIFAKLLSEGFGSLVESVWRNFLRQTEIGSWLSSILGEVFVEKLVMAPRVGYWPHIREPRTFNEKLVYRKYFTDDDRFARIADKYSVRDYVRSRAKEEILPDLYHVTTDPETIPFDSLPNEFVIKTGNKGTIIVDDKSEIDVSALKDECQDALATPHGISAGEYWYADADQKLLVEERLYGYQQDVPLDYKFLIFHGRVEYIQVNIDRFGDHTKSVYDRNWNYLHIEYNHKQGPQIDRPTKLEKMIEIAEQLAADFDFMRVDLYHTRDDRVVFGELTPAPASGIGGFKPISVDFEWGEKW